MLKQCARHAVTLRKDTQAITHCACSHCFEHIKGVSNNRTHTFEKTKKDMLPCLCCCHHRNFAFHALVSFNYVSLVYMVPLGIHARHFSLEKIYLEKFCMGCSQHATAQGVFCSFVLLTSGSVLLICDWTLIAQLILHFALNKRTRQLVRVTFWCTPFLF